MIARRLGLTAGLAGLGVTALLVLSTAPADALAPRAQLALPRVPNNLGVPVQALEIRPATIIYTGDGTGLLTGATLRSSLRWSSWTAAAAIGRGDNQINRCTPSCAGGRYAAYPVKLEAWRPATLRGQLVFTRLTVWYTGKRPRGEPRHYTFTDIYSNGWGFGPPGPRGYCVDTSGQPPAAGCANIAALP